MSTTSKEIIHLRRLLGDIGIATPTPTALYCDNRSAIQIASNPVFHERTKHIEVDCHFVRHQFLAGTISLPHISSMEQIADFFTKLHPTPCFRYLVSKLLVFDPP